MIDVISTGTAQETQDTRYRREIAAIESSHIASQPHRDLTGSAVGPLPGLFAATHPGCLFYRSVLPVLSSLSTNEFSVIVWKPEFLLSREWATQLWFQRLLLAYPGVESVFDARPAHVVPRMPRIHPGPKIPAMEYHQDVEELSPAHLAHQHQLQESRHNICCV